MTADVDSSGYCDATEARTLSHLLESGSAA
jgi:hypothetical protein